MQNSSEAPIHVHTTILMNAIKSVVTSSRIVIDFHELGLRGMIALFKQDEDDSQYDAVSQMTENVVCNQNAMN